MVQNVVSKKTLQKSHAHMPYIIFAGPVKYNVAMYVHQYHNNQK